MDFFHEKGFSCYALDLPGHGRRKAEQGLWKKTLSGYVGEVVRIHGELQNPVVIGHSMGGFIAMKSLELIQPPAAVLVAPITYRNLPRRTLLKIIFQYPLMALRFLFLMPLKITSVTMYRRMFLKNAPDKVAKKGFENISRESSLALMGAAVPFTWLRPKQNRAPVLVLAAEHDYFFPVSTEMKTARAYRGDFILYPDMGHNLMTEEGWETVAEDIFSWLKKRIK
jgi:alpha-beta hydrolase superfamily lysophospholipase